MSDPNEQFPSKIEHLVDTDFDPKTGECEYYYNHLVYTFEHEGTQITARSYLDNIREVSILQCPNDIDIEKELSGILAYLRMRYETIKQLGPDGYFEI